MTTKNIYKILLYISSKDRDTIINEISEYIDSIDDISACGEDNLDDFLSSCQRGTEYDKAK